MSCQRSQKRTKSERIVLSEYHNNDIENCLVTLAICYIGFITLPALDRLLIAVNMRHFLQKVPFENLQKQMKTTIKISLVFVLAIMTFAAHKQVFLLLAGFNPFEKVSHTRRKTFLSSQGDIMC